MQRLADKTLAGEVDRATAAVCGQLLNVKLRALEVGRKLRESEELESRLEELEQALEQRKLADMSGRVKRLERLAGTCARCSEVVLCRDTDGEPMNADRWREFEAGCPACGRRPPTIRVVWDDEHEE